MLNFAVLIELYLSEFTLHTKNTLSTQKSQFKFLGSVEYCTLKFYLTFVKLSLVKIKSIKCTIKCCKMHMNLCLTFRYCIHQIIKC